MTIDNFKTVANSENFHYENIYGIHYYSFGFHIFKTVEKLTGKIFETYYTEDQNTRIPITKEQFLNKLN
jgi:hypothetical protein